MATGQEENEVLFDRFSAQELRVLETGVIVAALVLASRKIRVGFCRSEEPLGEGNPLRAWPKCAASAGVRVT